MYATNIEVLLGKILDKTATMREVHAFIARQTPNTLQTPNTRDVDKKTGTCEQKQVTVNNNFLKYVPHKWRKEVSLFNKFASESLKHNTGDVHTQFKLQLRAFIRRFPRTLTPRIRGHMYNKLFMDNFRIIGNRKQEYVEIVRRYDESIDKFLMRKKRKQSRIKPNKI